MNNKQPLPFEIRPTGDINTIAAKNMINFCFKFKADKIDNSGYVYSFERNKSIIDKALYQLVISKVITVRQAEAIEKQLRSTF